MNAEKSFIRRRYQGGLLSTVINPKETQNAFALIELELPAGAEPPPHIHEREDEAFYVIEGQVRVSIGNEVTLLEPGMGIFAPRNISHSFQIISPSARFLNLISPGALWNYFMEFSTPFSDEGEMPGQAPAPPDLHHMLDVITRQYGVKFLLPAQ